MDLSDPQQFTPQINLILKKIGDANEPLQEELWIPAFRKKMEFQMNMALSKENLHVKLIRKVLAKLLLVGFRGI